jgi:formamidopyrimidine-DNA glycosylase
MPELPEVETVKTGLSELLPGLKISEIKSNWSKSLQADEGIISLNIIGSEVLSVNRRGKTILIVLDSDYTLLTHLKMTGQMVYRGKKNFGAGHPNYSLVGVLPDNSTRVIIGFDNGDTLYFNDQRKFGWIRVIPTKEVEKDKFIASLGPEPLDKSFTKKMFILQVRKKPRSSIKAVLLNQNTLAGLGNIYTDESLWLSKIHPSTKVEEISDRQLGILYNSIISVLRLGIEKGGSTDKNYVDVNGNKGSYLNFANVFRRDKQPCPRCKEIIIKIRVAGRGTHLCPNCQRTTAI